MIFQYRFFNCKNESLWWGCHLGGDSCGGGQGDIIGELLKTNMENNALKFFTVSK
jgi:hypothetical protein